jgi:hypothetical protein
MKMRETGRLPSETAGVHDDEVVVAGPVGLVAFDPDAPDREGEGRIGNRRCLASRGL